MTTLPPTEKRNLTQWIAIVISLVALMFSSLEWWNNRSLAKLQAEPRVSFVESSGSADPVMGLELANDGPLVEIKEINYYMDKKPTRRLDDAIQMANLPDDVKDSINTFEFGKTSFLAVGEKRWIVSLESKGTTQKKSDRFIDFIDHHFAFEVKACSLLTSKCETQCSTEGLCK